MDHSSGKILQGTNEASKKDEVIESIQLEEDQLHNLEEKQGNIKDIPRVDIIDHESNKNVREGAVAAEYDPSGEVNMEAEICRDDVIRAGGYGARDDISSFLPVASDTTDFEAFLRDARDYEDQQEEIKRPGLGWKEAAK